MPPTKSPRSKLFNESVFLLNNYSDYVQKFRVFYSAWTHVEDLNSDNNRIQDSSPVIITVSVSPRWTTFYIEMA